MEDYEKIDESLVETVEQPPIVRKYSREELESSLAASEAALAVKELEIEGARAEVERISGLIAKCDELGIATKSDETNA